MPRLVPGTGISAGSGVSQIIADSAGRSPPGRLAAPGRASIGHRQAATTALATGEGSDPSIAKPSRTCTAGWAIIRGAVPR